VPGLTDRGHSSRPIGFDCAFIARLARDRDIHMRSTGRSGGEGYQLQIHS
jgi:hypothetical protein